MSSPNPSEGGTDNPTANAGTQLIGNYQFNIIVNVDSRQLDDLYARLQQLRKPIMELQDVMASFELNYSKMARLKVEKPVETALKAEEVKTPEKEINEIVDKATTKIAKPKKMGIPLQAKIDPKQTKVPDAEIKKAVDTVSEVIIDETPQPDIPYVPNFVMVTPRDRQIVPSKFLPPKIIGDLAIPFHFDWKFDTGRLTWRQLYTLYGAFSNARNAALAFDRSIEGIGHTMLWFGLGTMFLTMNLRQLVSEFTKAKKEALSFVGSLMSMDEKIESTINALIEYGAGSKEGQRALRELRYAQLQMQVSIREMEAMFEMQGLTMAMLFASMLGQAFGSTSMLRSSMLSVELSLNKLFESFNRLKMIVDLYTNSAYRQSAANAVSAASSQTLGFSVNMSFGALLKHNIAAWFGVVANQKLSVSFIAAKLGADLFIGSLTFGLGILTSWAFSILYTQKAMGDFRSELSRLSGELGIRTSLDDVSGSFNMLTNSIELTNSALLEYDRLSREVSAPLITGTSAKLGMGNGSKIVNIDSIKVEINTSAPVEKMSENIGDEIVESVRRSGVYI